MIMIEIFFKLKSENFFYIFYNITYTRWLN